jgi:lysozyme family protein
MASFDVGYEYTAKQEGGWAMWSAREGGETFRGIARVHHPNNPIWKVLDMYGQQQGIPKPQMPTKGVVHTSYASMINKRFMKDGSITNVIKRFYYDNFWNRNNLNDIKDQRVANAIYDSVVQHGRGANLARAALGIIPFDKIGTGGSSPLSKGEIQLINSIEPNKFLQMLAGIRAPYLIKQGQTTSRAFEMLKQGVQFVKQIARETVDFWSPHQVQPRQQAPTIQTPPVQLDVLGHIEQTVNYMLNNKK